MSLSNELETASDQQQEELAWSPSNGSAVDPDVAAQYRAVQEAQLSHEQSIEELRQQVRDYGERLATLGSNGDGPGATAEAVLLRIDALERKVGEAAPDPLLNEIVHRLAALESSGGPRGGGADPRVKELAAEVEKLRKRQVEPAPPDPRTDDLVLRIASLEANLRRSQEAHADASRILARIESIEQEFKAESEKRFEDLSGQVQDVREKLEQQAGELPAPEVLSRLSGVESALEGYVTGSSFEQLSEKVKGLEDSPADSEDSEARARIDALESSAVTQEALEALHSKLESLEANPDEQPDWLSAEDASSKFAERSSIEQLESRLAGLENGQSENEWLSSEEASAKFVDQTVVEQLESRLAGLESGQSEQDWLSAEDAGEKFADRSAVEQLESRLTGLESAPEQSWLTSDDADARFVDQAAMERIETRLSGLESAEPEQEWLSSEEASTKFADREAVEQLESRLAGVEGGPTDGSWLSAEEASSKFAERESVEQLESRLAGIESGQPDQEWREEASSKFVEQAALEQLESRVAGLESGQVDQDQGWLSADEASSKFADRAALDELESRIAGLQSGQADGDWGEAAASFAERAALEQLETRLASLEGSDSDSSWMPAEEARNRFFELEERIGTSSADGQDASWTELAARVSELEQERPAEGGQPADESRLQELTEQLNTLQARLDGFSNLPVDSELSSEIGELRQRVDGMAAMGPAGEPSVELLDRLARLEAAQADVGAQDLTDLTARIQDLEVNVGGTGGDDERWSQWARNTLAEVGNLREQVEQLRQSGSTGGSAPGFDDESLVQLGKGISEGVNKSDNRSLRAQMYFVYFTMGMLWMVVLYVVMQLRGA